MAQFEYWMLHLRGACVRNQCIALAAGDEHRAFLAYTIVSKYWLRMLRGAVREKYPNVRAFYRGTVIAVYGDYVRWLDQITKEDIYMSAKSRSIAVKRWANVSLSDQDKENISAMDFSMDDILLEIASMVVSGYRFSLTYDLYSSALQVSLVCGDQDSPNYELGLSARHPDLDFAIKSLWYKHRAICRDSWADFTGPTSMPSWS